MSSRHRGYNRTYSRSGRGGRGLSHNTQRSSNYRRRRSRSSGDADLLIAMVTVTVAVTVAICKAIVEFCIYLVDLFEEMAEERKKRRVARERAIQAAMSKSIDRPRGSRMPHGEWRLAELKRAELLHRAGADQYGASAQVAAGRLALAAEPTPFGGVLWMIARPATIAGVYVVNPRGDTDRHLTQAQHELQRHGKSGKVFLPGFGKRGDQRNLPAEWERDNEPYVRITFDVTHNWPSWVEHAQSICEIAEKHSDAASELLMQLRESLWACAGELVRSPDSVGGDLATGLSRLEQVARARVATSQARLEEIEAPVQQMEQADREIERASAVTSLNAIVDAAVKDHEYEQIVLDDGSQSLRDTTTLPPSPTQ